METTLLVVAGKKLRVPRVLKRALQIAVAVGDGLLSGRVSSVQAATANWLAFVRRPDILAIMTLTALVTVLFVYWQRDQERK